jgi:ABC-type multidrug transport system fused ATPase/permease subunit
MRLRPAVTVFLAVCLAAPPQRIRFEDIGFAYQEVPVLRSISFEARAGELSYGSPRLGQT